MYRYIKSNGAVFHQLKNLNFLLEFIPKPTAITSTEETSISISQDIEKYVIDYLDEITQLVSIRITELYPVFTRSTKPNKTITSVYLPVALRDEELPYRLKVGFEGFADINRISNHSQRSELSEDILNERDKPIGEFKSDLSDQIKQDSRIPYNDRDKTDDEIKAEKLKILDGYEFPEDFSIVLISSDAEETFTDISELVDEICKLIYLRLTDINR